MIEDVKDIWVAAYLAAISGGRTHDEAREIAFSAVDAYEDFIEDSE